MREIVHLQVGQCGNQIGSKAKNFIIGSLNNLSINKNSAFLKNQSFINF